MREILFRGRIKGSNSEHEELNWAFGNFVKELETGRCFISDLSHFDKNTKLSDIVLEVDPETVCQYTGLTDKNGRKIFEGDIVQYVDEVIGKEKVDEVEYNETHAAFCRIHKSKMGLQYLFIDEAVANKCEVIGNIFDNPELIGE